MYQKEREMRQEEKERQALIKEKERQEEKQVWGFAMAAGTMLASAFTGYEAGVGWGIAVFGLLLWATALTGAILADLHSEPPRSS